MSHGDCKLQISFLPRWRTNVQRSPKSLCWISGATSQREKEVEGRKGGKRKRRKGTEWMEENTPPHPRDNFAVTALHRLARQVRPGSLWSFASSQCMCGHVLGGAAGHISEVNYGTSCRCRTGATPPSAIVPLTTTSRPAVLVNSFIEHPASVNQSATLVAAFKPSTKTTTLLYSS